MNKIFRVIWNTSTQSWVAVSELARGRVKSTSNNTAVAGEMALSVSLGIAMVLMPISVEAAQAISAVGVANVNIETKAQGTGNHQDSILIGSSATLKLNTDDGGNHNSGSVHNNIVIGNNAQGRSEYGVAIGFNASTDSSTATGYAHQIAIGTNSKAHGQESIAIGLNSYTASKHSIAFGPGARAAGQRAMALGLNATATTDAVALGSGASATKAKSVALGMGSTTAVDATQEGDIVVNGVTYDPITGQATSTSMLVSVGSAGGERQIKHVAPGKISSDSTDAINGSQLYSITKGLQSRPIKFEGNTGNTTRTLGDTLVINGAGTSGSFSGKNVKTVASKGRIEIQIAEDPKFTTVTTTGAITAGGLTVASNKAVNMNNNRIQNVGNGTAPNDAVNKGQLDAISNLRITGDTGTGTVPLETGTLGIKGTANYIETTGAGSDVTIKLAKTITDM